MKQGRFTADTGQERYYGLRNVCEVENMEMVVEA
jgi:hypothetical protein